jgi:hypothetical protein
MASNHPTPEDLRSDDDQNNSPENSEGHNGNIADMNSGTSGICKGYSMFV